MFPEYTTGKQQVPTDQIAHAMVEALIAFSGDHELPMLDFVRIVIYNPEMVQSFVNALKDMQSKSAAETHAHSN